MDRHRVFARRGRIALVLALAPVFAFGVGLGVSGAWADGDEFAPPVTDPLTRKECGDCHMAFQPAFLPARSWRRMMNELDDHFGEDASLGPDATRAITDYLTRNAGDVVRRGLASDYMRWVKPDGTPQRITENPAFLREHRFPDKVWKRADVVVKSNCPACHKAAERGWYEDD